MGKDIMSLASDLSCLFSEAKPEPIQEGSVQVKETINKHAIVSNVPEPLVDWFADKINKLVVREASKAYNEVEKSAEQFIAAATSASPSTD